MMTSKKKFVFGLAIIVLIIFGGQWYRMRVNSDADPFAGYKAAMMQDGAGGATPAETLAMFVAALRANDAYAAAQLFMLDDNGSRAKWNTQLEDLKLQGMLVKMADDIEKNAKATRPAYEGNAKFEVLNQDGSVGALIVLQFNKFSGVWKLQSL